MKFTLNNYIVLEPIEETSTAIVTSSQGPAKNNSEGVVKFIGTQVNSEIATGLKVGDTVYCVMKYGTPITVEGAQLVSVKDTDIIGVK